jgi:hypothetical protein
MNVNRITLFSLLIFTSLSAISLSVGFAQENRATVPDVPRSPDRNSAEARDPVLGASVTDSEGSNLGVITDILGTNQSNIPLAAIKLPDIPILVVIPVSELTTKTGNLKYWGTKRQFDEVPKRYGLLASGTSSLASKGTLGSALSVLATPTVPNSPYMADTDAGGTINSIVRPNPSQDNPYSRAGSDIKSLWGGTNSTVRKPF